MRGIYCAVSVIGIMASLISGCGGGGKGLPEQVRAKPNLLLTQAQFIMKKGDDGKEHPQPGPAKLLLLYHVGEEKGWVHEVLEDPESNVFHKAMLIEPGGELKPGILTIGANKAELKLWNLVNGKWEGEVLYENVFGGTENRLRDMEIADVTGDGRKDIIIATHDQGVILVLESSVGGKLTPHELSREPDIFVHEIETGDVNGDGITEFFSTPSAPNKLDGTIQPGKIMMYRFDGRDFVSRPVEEFPSRHVKEILCTDFEGTEKPVLFAALEGENLGGESETGDNTRICLYRFTPDAQTREDITGLPGNLCRFLNAGDVDGDGNNELIASTHKSGIWLIEKEDGAWTKTLIDRESSGFEHATYIVDLDGDGKNEIYVASDDQKQVRKYTYTSGKNFNKEILCNMDGDFITFNLTPGYKLAAKN